MDMDVLMSHSTWRRERRAPNQVRSIRGCRRGFSPEPGLSHSRLKPLPQFYSSATRKPV